MNFPLKNFDFFIVMAKLLIFSINCQSQSFECQLFFNGPHFLNTFYSHSLTTTHFSLNLELFHSCLITAIRHPVMNIILTNYFLLLKIFLQNLTDCSTFTKEFIAFGNFGSYLEYSSVNSISLYFITEIIVVKDRILGLRNSFNFRVVN